MKETGLLSPASSLEHGSSIVDRALETLRSGGADKITAAMALLAADGAVLETAPTQPLLAELLAAVLDALEADAVAPDALAFFSSLSAQAADLASNMLYFANFPDGHGDLKSLPDATVLCMAHLLAASGQVDHGCALLDKAAQNRTAMRFTRAVHATRCHLLAIDGALRGLWQNRLRLTIESAGAAKAIAANPLDVETYRAAARSLSEEGHYRQAFDILATATALPIDQDSKRGLGEDFGLLVAYLHTQGLGGIPTISRNVSLALDAYPAVAREAWDTLGSNLQGDAALGLGTQHRARAQAYFEPFFKNPAPAYPQLLGRPEVNTVWLEVTNFCNQKCTFCPDMHREDARQWLPLDQIKRTIDDLAENVIVGSMQLNAYGEPLLHPQIDEILTYLRDRKVPWPTFFTTHGMTLVDKKLKQLSRNYPQGIAVSLHNDSQASYEATRSAKIGDYDTLVSRVTKLMVQMVHEGAAAHVRLYQMVSNGFEDRNVAAETRAAFPDSVERMVRHVRKWEAIAASIARDAPAERGCLALTNSDEEIEKAFLNASNGDGNKLAIMRWIDETGHDQVAFMSPRPVCTYANLLLEYDQRWNVKRKVVNSTRCGFTTTPSLAIFASGKLGICCIDMNSTATFGALSDFSGLRDALDSPQARKLFAELSNGIATSRGCQICLASGEQLCRTDS